MNRFAAFPFLTLPDECVGFGGWNIGDPGQPLWPATDILEGWDYERDLEVEISVELDLDDASGLLSLNPENADLVLVLKAGTGTGSVARRVDRIGAVRIESKQQRTSIVTTVPSSRLSGRLRLEASIVLGSVPGITSPLSPVIPGARLWSQYKDILLEDGGDSRFPVEMISFSEVFRGQSYATAPWYVHWRAGNLHADFAGSVRVYVNSDNRQVSDRFVAGDGPTLQAILGDVISQIVSTALELPDCREHLEDCEEGSVGSQILHWLDMAFPNQSIATIAGSKETTPGRFRASLLAAAQVGEQE